MIIEWWNSNMTAEEEQHFYKLREHQLGKWRLEDWSKITTSMRNAAKCERGRKHGAVRRT